MLGNIIELFKWMHIKITNNYSGEYRSLLFRNYSDVSIVHMYFRNNVGFIYVILSAGWVC